MKIDKVAVIGAGSWGSVLANVLVQNGLKVQIWTRESDQVKELNEQHTNRHYLPELKYDQRLVATADLQVAVAGEDVVIIAVPTKAVRDVAGKIDQILQQQTKKPLIVHVSKGLELGTHKRISQVIEEEIPANDCTGIVVLSGPSHAEEVARKDITLITAAAKDLTTAKTVQQLFMNNYFRVYTNDDIIGVELGAAFKNIIALGAGALHGLGYGDDAKAALMTRGLAEISRLGVAMGAKAKTFLGLSGVGDLIVTCTSVHSRNWRAGDQLGKGIPLKEVINNMGMVIEGISTTKAAYELAQQQQIEMPITEAIYDVLYNDRNVKQVIAELMQREGRSE